MIRRSFAFAVFALLPFAGACDEYLFEQGYTGTYDLSWVNGRRVPAIVLESTTAKSTYRAEISFGTLHLRRDDTFSIDFELRETENGTVTRSTRGYSGTYDRYDRDLYLYFVDPATNRDRTLSGFVRDGYVEILVSGVLEGQVLQYGFER